MNERGREGKGEEGRMGGEGKAEERRKGKERREEKREKMFPDSFVCFDFCYVLCFWFFVVFIRENKNIKLAVEDLGEMSFTSQGLVFT